MSSAYVLVDRRISQLTHCSVKVKVMLRRLSWCQAPICGPRPDFHYCQTVVVCLCPLTRGKVCRLLLLLTLASESFSSTSPAELTTVLYCLRFETPPTWKARSPYLYPPGEGWSSYTPRHCVPFSSPPTTHRAAVEVYEPASTRGNCQLSTNCPGRNISAQNAEKAPFLCCCSIVSVGTCLFEKPLLSKGSCIFAYLAVDAQHRVYILQYC
jgi:hypothetical protein